MAVSVAATGGGEETGGRRHGRAVASCRLPGAPQPAVQGPVETSAPLPFAARRSSAATVASATP